MNKDFRTLEYDLYIKKEDIKKMRDEGESAVGYVEDPGEGYKLVYKSAFQPVTEEDVIEEGKAYEVVFIGK